jgi:hypothetical protein
LNRVDFPTLGSPTIPALSISAISVFYSFDIPPRLERARIP